MILVGGNSDALNLQVSYQLLSGENNLKLILETKIKKKKKQSWGDFVTLRQSIN